MIKITQQEAKLVRKYYPYVNITRTVHKYYMDENDKAIRFLKNYSTNKGVRS